MNLYLEYWLFSSYNICINCISQYSWHTHSHPALLQLTSPTAILWVYFRHMLIFMLLYSASFYHVIVAFCTDMELVYLIELVWWTE